MNPIFPVQPSSPGMVTDFSKIGDLENLKAYLGKVVKFTSDWGQTWNYFFLDQIVYDQNQEILGIKCFSEKRVWNDRMVGASVLFTKDAFVKGPFLQPQSYFERASYDEFSDRTFEGIAGSGKLPEEAASKLCLGFDPDFPLCKAPLTLIRSAKPSQLAVSILFDSKYDPRDPVFPSPTAVEPKSRTYTWNVQSHENRTLSVEGTDDKVKMIWWEAIRKTAPIPFDPNANGVTVATHDLKGLLQEILQKKGVKESEAEAFADYWNQSFQADSGREAAPYVAVELVEESDLDKFLPKMTVESQDADFEVKRFYFRFQPSDELKGKERGAYLESLPPSSFGPNAVIDLGGEVVSSKYQRADKGDSKEFIQKFIQKHIIA